jgi:hypothetical protein
MSEKQMEKNLSYGDCFNFFGSLLGLMVGDVQVKELDEKKKNN